MKSLTAKEEEIMRFFWEKGPMFVKQLVELYEEPPRISIPCLPLCEDWRIKVIFRILPMAILISIMP